MSPPNAIMGLHENGPARRTPPGPRPTGGSPVDSEHRTCQNCGTLLEWRPGEPRRDFERRMFCNRDCWSKGKRKQWRKRFWAKVDQRGPDECWPWTGCLHQGYGEFLVADRRTRRAHIIMAQEFHGEGGPGLEVRHLCGNRACVNPNHLKWGTRQENMHDMVLHGTSVAKLRPRDVRIIRWRLGKGHSHAAIARDYGLAAATIDDLAAGRTWGWVE